MALFLVNFSIAIPAFLCLFRLQYASKRYVPFFLAIWFGFLNDMISYAFIIKVQSNMINSNIYILIEYMIILVQFAIWNRKPVAQYALYAAAGMVVWIVDNIYLHSLSGNNSIFRLFYSFVIVLFSLDQFNKIILYEKPPLGKNSVFLICTGFILFFGFKAFMESFNIFHVGLSRLFLTRLFLILSGVNLLSNLLYAYAILCIPRKQEFTLPY